MDFDLDLFVRELHDGAALVTVAADTELTVYGVDLDRALLDLELLISDRLERSHPSQLHRFASADNQRRVGVRADALVAVWRGNGRESETIEVSALVSRHKDHDRVYLPTLALRAWVPRGEDLDEALRGLLRDHAEELPLGEILGARVARSEELRRLRVVARPAPLAAFTGRMLGQPMLPEPCAEDGESSASGPTALGASELLRRRGDSANTPWLDAIANDWTMRARDGELRAPVGVDELVSQLGREVRGGEGVALVLVGPAGIGKTSVIQGLAMQLHAEAKARGSRKMTPFSRLCFVDATRLIASKSPFSDWRSQTLGVIDEARRNDVVLYLGDPLDLLDAGKSAQSEENIAQLLRGPIQRRQLRIVAEATPETFAQLKLRDPGFARLFTPIPIDEPSADRSRALISAIASRRAEPLRVESSAVAAARELGARFAGHDASVHAQSLSLLLRSSEDALAERDSELELARRAGDDLRRPATLEQRASFRARLASIDSKHAIDRRRVLSTFCRESGMPEVLVRDDLPLDLDAVRAALAARIMGQDEALERAVELVSLIKSGLSDPERPLGSFLFVGPTGVGKTETAKALASLLYGSEDRLIRFDMSEMVTSDSVRRFVGLGGQPGKLVSDIRRQPFCVLLLDEIEKAHPVAFDALLQVLGEARLSDEAGRTASFRNVVIVMTSNLGVDTLRRGVGFGEETTSTWTDHFKKEAQRFFRPELFNRIEVIVPFSALPKSSLEGILRRQLELIGKREGLRARSSKLDVSPDLAAHLVALGTDARLGARPLKRALEQHLVAPLSAVLAKHRGAPSAISATLGSDEVLFEDSPADLESGRATRLAKKATQLAELRYFLQRAALTPALRALAFDVDRSERLLSNPRYLRGFDELRAELTGIGERRSLQSEFEELCRRSESLEDLAAEAVYVNDEAALEPLTAEREELIQSIRSFAIRLALKDEPNADHAVLLMRGGAGCRDLIRATVRAYETIARRRELGCRVWRVVEREAREDELSVERIKTIQASRPRARTKDPLRVREFELVEEHPQRAADELVDRFCFAAEEDSVRVPFALELIGHRARAMTLGEVGTHEAYLQGTTRSIQVRLENKALLTEVLDELRWVEIDAGWSAIRVRVHRENQRLLEAPAQSLKLPLRRDLSAAFEVIMDARMVDAAFFAGAFAALRREESEE